MERTSPVHRGVIPETRAAGRRVRIFGGSPRHWCLGIEAGFSGYQSGDQAAVEVEGFIHRIGGRTARRISSWRICQSTTWAS